MTTIISQTHFGVAGGARLIAIAAFSNSELVTACRNESGILLLIGWRIAPDTNKITRLGDTSHEEVGEVDETAMVILGRIVVTAVRDGSGNLLLISWSALSLETITRLGDSHHTGTGHASLIAITAVT